MRPFSYLTASRYLMTINDTIHLSPQIILTPLPWLATLLVGDASPESWSANKATIYRSVPFKNGLYDVIVCLPGASMAMITMEEAIAAGAKRIVFVGTGSSVEGRHDLGDLVINPDVTSVINPFEEHERWPDIANHEVVDMEAGYLRELATKRKIAFKAALIISDRIWEDRWEQDPSALKERINESVERMKAWL